MANPVGWFEIYVNDLARARHFYEAVLGVTLTKLDAPSGGSMEIELWAFPMERGAAGASGALVKMPGVTAGGSSVMVYFSCADCAVEAGRVTANGGKVERPKFPIGQYGFVAIVQDTEGNMFGLHSMQ